MSVRIVTRDKHTAPSEANTYFIRLTEAFKARGLAVRRHTVKEWRSGKVSAHPKRDLLVMDAAEAADVGGEYGIVGVAFGSAMETALRTQDASLLPMARAERAYAGVKRKFTVAVSDWAAIYFQEHAGVKADRVVYTSADTDRYFASERQRLRCPEKVVVMHDCEDAAIVTAVAKHLPDGMELRALSAESDTAEALRSSDIFLALDAGHGGPSVVADALASGVIVVGTDTGVLWALDGDPVEIGGGSGSMRVSVKANAAILDWQYRAWPSVVAEAVVKAWAIRTNFAAPNTHALQWLSFDTFAQKWIDALRVAMKRFGVKDDKAGGTVRGPVPKPAKPAPVSAQAGRVVTPHGRRKKVPK